MAFSRCVHSGSWAAACSPCVCANACAPAELACAAAYLPACSAAHLASSPSQVATAPTTLGWLALHHDPVVEPHIASRSSHTQHHKQSLPAACCLRTPPYHLHPLPPPVGTGKTKKAGAGGKFTWGSMLADHDAAASMDRCARPGEGGASLEAVWVGGLWQLEPVHTLLPVTCGVDCGGCSQCMRCFLSSAGWAVAAAASA